MAKPIQPRAIKAVSLFRLAVSGVRGSRDVNGSFKGLDLDEKVLRNIYYKSAMKWYPGML